MTNEVPSLEELMEKAKSLPDDKFPNWIFNITFHSFEDCPNYWVDYDMSDPRAVLLNTAVKTKNIEDYLEKHRIWKEYLEDLSIKYGMTLSMIPIMFKAGLIKEFVPEEPRLSRKSKEVKKFIKTGKLPFKQESEYKNVIQFYVSEMIENAHLSEDEEDSKVVFRSPTKAEAEILDYAANQISARKRMAEFRNPKVGGERHVEYVGEYFRSLHRGEYDDKPKIFTDEGVDIGEILRQAKEEEDTPEYIREAELRSSKGTVFYDGEFHTEEEINRKQLSAAFAAAGVNPNVLQKNGLMKKKEVYIMKLQNGMSLDEDEPSKWEKKQKKREKKLRKKHMKSLGSMSSLLTENGFTGGFGMDEETSNGFDFEDLFKN